MENARPTLRCLLDDLKLALPAVEGALPDRALRGNEQAWSNIMDTAAAAKLLDLE